MKVLSSFLTSFVIVVTITLFSSCNSYSYVPSSNRVNYVSPSWAPPVYAGARYYYIPDIETYYDLTLQRFVYLANGRWYYSPDLPSIYAGFDLYNCFTVELNFDVYQPWLHHQYYNSHYPRYYYRDYYDYSNIPYVRGYSENNRRAIFWKENERNRARTWDDRNIKSNRNFKYSKPDYEQRKSSPSIQKRKTEQPNSYDSNNERRKETIDKRVNPRSSDSNSQNNESTSTRSSGQSTNYYGREIGQPVKVEKQMRESTNSNTRREINSSTNSNTRR